MNDPRIKAYDLQPMSCPSCQGVIDAATPITNGIPRGFKKGNIVICSYCSAILRMGDSAFARMTDVEVKNLDPVSKEVIRKALLVIRQRIDQEKRNA